MDGVLNQSTNKVHKHEAGTADFRTRCGATSHVSHDDLRLISVDRALEETATNRCGRCFDDGGGY